MILRLYASILPHSLLQFDRWLFHKINQTWTFPFFDGIMPFLRQQELWYFFYLFLLVFALYNFGIRGCWWVLGFIMTAVVGDLVSSHLIKAIFFRLRPCRDPEMIDQVRVLVNYCPQNSSFTSSHACNHFALAWFIFLTLNQTGSWRWLLFLWAFIICYAQIYVGVHYPLDIFGGALIGSVIGIAMSRVFAWQFGTLSLK